MKKLSDKKLEYFRMKLLQGIRITNQYNKIITDLYNQKFKIQAF